MTQYAVLLIGSEAAWAAATPAEQAAVFAMHGEFSRLLEERGHQISGGAQLDSTRTSRVLRMSDADVVTTEGPYVESVEQLGGLYLVESDDPDDLLEICEILARTGDTVEVRACLAPPAE